MYGCKKDRVLHDIFASIFTKEKKKIHQELVARTNSPQTKTGIVPSCKRETSTWVMPTLSATLVLHPGMSRSN